MEEFSMSVCVRFVLCGDERESLVPGLSHMERATRKNKIWRGTTPIARRDQDVVKIFFDRMVSVAQA